MPTTLEALILLFVFAVPAYLTITVYKAHNPIHYYREKQSPIEQAALYIFLGTVVNIFTIYLFWLLWLFAILVQNLLPGGAVLALDIPGNSIGVLSIVFLLIIAYFAIGVCFSFLVGKTLGALLPAEEPLWITELNKCQVKQPKADMGVTWVLMHLKNGDRCLGLVRSYKWTGDKENAIELLMVNTVYQLAHSGEKEPPARVLLRSNDILCLSAYPDQTEGGNG